MNTGSSIVVIDPRADDYRTLIDALAQQGIELHVLTDIGAELAVCCCESPTVWVVNVRLTGSLGTDLVPLLHQRHPGVPVCLVSDRHSLEDEVLARCAGAEMYFTKPLQLEWLLALCELGFDAQAAEPAESVENTTDAGAGERSRAVAGPLTDLEPCVLTPTACAAQ